MRFGGHETFPIREGWLRKGLKLLVEEPEKLDDEYAADWLGVGRNMGKAIKHWLVATGLAIRTMPLQMRKSSLTESELGKLINEYDPYFIESGTWWILHVNLVNNPNDAYSWNWFFNSFSHTRFERSVCIEGINRHLQLTKTTSPSMNTLHRDIGCLLNSYSKKIPGDDVDPEDASHCPFIELGLLTHFQSTGYYVLNQGFKNIPYQILGYALSKSMNGENEISVQKAARAANGPGRIFALTSESLFEILLRIEENGDKESISIESQAGERIIKLVKKSQVEWLKNYYTEQQEEVEC